MPSRVIRRRRDHAHLLHERGRHGDVATTLTRAGALAPDIDFLVYRFFQSRNR